MDRGTLELPYRQEIAEYVNQVVQQLNPKAMILYGSAVRRTYGIGSDVDIMIIAENLPDRFLDRPTLLYELNRSRAPIDPAGYTPQEIEKMMIRGQPALYDALEEGIVLYDDNFVKEARQAWENIKTEKGWRKTKTGWIKSRP